MALWINFYKRKEPADDIIAINNQQVLNYLQQKKNLEKKKKNKNKNKIGNNTKIW